MNLDSFFDSTDEGMTKDDIMKEWSGMPEYNNEKEPPPEVEVTIRFKTKKDFELFNQLMKENIYKVPKVFDGMQRKEKKWAWFPLKPKGSSFKYVNEANK